MHWGLTFSDLGHRVVTFQGGILEVSGVQGVTWRQNGILYPSACVRMIEKDKWETFEAISKL